MPVSTVPTVRLKTKHQEKLAKHLWTKEEIKTLISLWETMTLEEVARELKVHPTQAQYMAALIRKEGYALPKKRVIGRARGLVKEVIRELKHR